MCSCDVSVFLNKILRYLFSILPFFMQKCLVAKIHGRYRVQKLSDSVIEVDVPESPYGLCGRKATDTEDDVSWQWLI